MQIFLKKIAADFVRERACRPMASTVKLYDFRLSGRQRKDSMGKRPYPCTHRTGNIAEWSSWPWSVQNLTVCEKFDEIHGFFRKCFHICGVFTLLKAPKDLRWGCHTFDIKA